MNADIFLMAVLYVYSNKEQPLSIEIKILPHWMRWLQCSALQNKKNRFNVV